MKVNDEEKLEALASAAVRDPSLDSLRRAVDTVRGSSAEDGLSDIQLARVGHRLRAPRVPTRRPALLLGLRLGTLSAVLLIGGAVGATATLVTMRLIMAEAPTVTPAVDVIVHPGAHRAIKRRISAPAAADVPVAAPESQPALVEPVPPPPVAVPIRERPVIAAPARAAAPAESGTTRQARALSAALASLRRDRDARAALQQLDAYLAGFPQGTFTDEARMLRVEALAALGDRERAESELRELAARRPDLRLRLEKMIADL